jgi:hypothetical protein
MVLVVAVADVVMWRKNVISKRKEKEKKLTFKR